MLAGMGRASHHFCLLRARAFGQAERRWFRGRELRGGAGAGPDDGRVRGLPGGPDGGLYRRRPPARSERFQDAQERALEGVRKLRRIRQVASYAGSKDPSFISEDGKKSYAIVTSNVSVDKTRNVVDGVRRRSVRTS